MTCKKKVLYFHARKRLIKMQEPLQDPCKNLAARPGYGEQWRLYKPVQADIHCFTAAHSFQESCKHANLASPFFLGMKETSIIFYHQKVADHHECALRNHLKIRNVRDIPEIPHMQGRTPKRDVKRFVCILVC